MSGCRGCGEMGCVCWDTGPAHVHSYDESRGLFKWRREPRRWPKWAALLLALALAVLLAGRVMAYARAHGAGVHEPAGSHTRVSRPSPRPGRRLMDKAELSRHNVAAILRHADEFEWTLQGFGMFRSSLTG